MQRAAEKIPDAASDAARRQRPPSPAACAGFKRPASSGGTESAPPYRPYAPTSRADNQVIFVLNRRDSRPRCFATTAAGLRSARVAILHYTLHQARHHLRCHHCDSQRPCASNCPSCGSICFTGWVRDGTAWSRCWRPSSPACRSHESTVLPASRKGALEHLAEVHRGGARILIGTHKCWRKAITSRTRYAAIWRCWTSMALFRRFSFGGTLRSLYSGVSGRAGRYEQTGRSGAPNAPS